MAKSHRSYVTVRNNGDRTTRLDLHRAKTLQGGDRTGHADLYD